MYAYLDIPDFNTLVPGTGIQQPPIDRDSTHRPLMSLVRMPYILRLLINSLIEVQYL